jgi:hypothetical protein
LVGIHHILIPTSAHTHQLTLYSLLQTKYNLSPHHAMALSDFLELMLLEKRAKVMMVINKSPPYFSQFHHFSGKAP